MHSLLSFHSQLLIPTLLHNNLKTLTANYVCTMATFSSKTFNSALYQSFRPGYNSNFFKMLYNYHAKHNGQFESAVDVGTGT